MIADKPAIPVVHTLAVSTTGSTAAHERAKTYPGGTHSTSCKLANDSYHYKVLNQNKIKSVFPSVSL